MRARRCPPFRRFPLAALAAAAALSTAPAAPPPALAQGSPAPATEPAAGGAPAAAGEVFFESLDVHVVNVEVYVTDKDGQPITGLTADDFEIKEDGRPQRITNFAAVHKGRQVAAAPAAPESAPAPPSPPPAPPGAPPAVPEVPEDQRLHLIVYLDNLHIRPFNRNRVAREVRGFLYENLRPEDRVMLVTFERSLHVRQPFTSDPLAIGQALVGIEELTGFAVQEASARTEVIRSIESSENGAEALAYADDYARERHADTVRSLEGLEEMIASLGGLPGRKALLYISDGIPMTPAEDLYVLADLKFAGEGVSGPLRARRYSLRTDFRELVAQANANRVTFYTLEAGGLRGHSSVSAESAGGNAGGSLFEADTTHFFNLVEPLEMMAVDTGGRAFYNTNNIAGALADMHTDLRSFYSLGYSPAHQGDGRYHRIEVEVKVRGAKVRHRNGYRDKTPAVRLTEGTLASLIHSVGVNPLGIDLVVAPPRRRDDGYYLVPIEVSIPLGALALVPQGEHYLGRLSVVTAVIDREGGTSPPEPVEIPITIPAAEIEAARTKSFVYEAALLMRPGVQEVAVGLRDELSGEASFVREVVRVAG